MLLFTIRIQLLVLASMYQIRAYRTTGESPSLSPELMEIICGLLLGDLNAERRSPNGNTRLRFAQGTGGMQRNPGGALHPHSS
jgi:hypothetical protein